MLNLGLMLLLVEENLFSKKEGYKRYVSMALNPFYVAIIFALLTEVVALYM